MKRTPALRQVTLAAVLVCLACASGTTQAAELILAERGISKAPVVVSGDASPPTAQAASDLVEYIEKVSGAHPSLVVGDPEKVPEHAIWVGFQPRLTELFPNLDFDFQHPEEILIAASEDHLVIAGRDRMAGQTQIEHGSANAVYVFLEDYLDVRWLWPGELGEDVVKRDTIAVAPLEYRFHPPFRQRADAFRMAKRGVAGDDWIRHQRLLHDSLTTHGGHAFTDWWERFHEEQPDYFALQPDGTRSGFPSAHNVKLCQSNRRVWDQWLAGVEETLKKNPGQIVFNASPNDGHSSGICVCDDCRAWDYPKGQPWRYRWQGVSQEYVAMSDRYVTFWNHLARKLRERFPNRGLFVNGFAYGPSTPPPVEAVPEENVIIGYVGHFPFTTDATREEQKKQWKGWADKASHMVYRPNLWYWAGGVWGLPEVSMQQTIEDFRFLGENSCVGLFVDTTWEHWATQAPQYYLMGQLAWDPLQDGHLVLKDYYRRGFGPAAGEIEAYWGLMEETRNRIVDSPDFRTGSRNRFRLIGVMEQAYTDDLLDRADGMLKQAASKVAQGPEIYRKRVDFIRAGFDFTRLLIGNIPLMARVRESNGEDAEAVKKALENWEAIGQLCKEAGPIALRYSWIRARVAGKGYMGGMQDYLGPVSEEFRKAAGLQ